MLLHRVPGFATSDSFGLAFLTYRGSHQRQLKADKSAVSAMQQLQDGAQAAAATSTATVQGTSQDMLSEKSKGKQREPTASARSQSPTGTAGRPSTIKSEMAERSTRRDRVSVSSRMNKSIVVRPREPLIWLIRKGS